MKTIQLPPMIVDDAVTWIETIEHTYDMRFNVPSPLSRMRRKRFKIVGTEVIESEMSGTPPVTRPNLPQ